MKKTILFVLLSLEAIITIAQPANSLVQVKQNSIALLGTYHFNNPNQDQFNIQSDNVFSGKRQQEIQQLAALLATYKPTHIAVEFNAADTALDEKYQRYVKGIDSLDAREAEQIGFRLARMLGHPHIYPVDAPDIRLDFDPGALATEYGPLLEQLGKEGNSIVSQINQWLQQYTIGQVLAKLNAPQLNHLNTGLYIKYLLPVGKNDQQPGAAAVARWYKRNLLMLHHIMKLAEGKSDQRILVILGQGHTAMLKQLLQDADVFKMEDIRHYLPAAKSLH